MRILKERSVGLVVDIQERLLPHIAENDALIQRTIILLEGLKILNVPILLTEQYRKGLGPTIPAIENALDTFDPLEKTSFSCCDNKGFYSELIKTGRKNVIICGIETHVCVMQTAIDLMEKGFQAVVIEDCISSRRLSDKKTAIERMRQEGAIISSVESILFELARISGTESFKAISKLVK